MSFGPPYDEVTSVPLGVATRPVSNIHALSSESITID
jgi:hypothetical protein